MLGSAIACTKVRVSGTTTPPSSGSAMPRVSGMNNATPTSQVSGRSFLLYKAGERVFSYVLLPLRYLDFLLERHPQASQIASSFYLIATKEAAVDSRANE